MVALFAFVDKRRVATPNDGHHPACASNGPFEKCPIASSGAWISLSKRLRISLGLSLNGHDTKANMVVASFRLEPLTVGRPIWPAIVGPSAAPPHARIVACPIFQCRRLCSVQVRTRGLTRFDTHHGLLGCAIQVQERISLSNE